MVDSKIIANAEDHKIIISEKYKLSNLRKNFKNCSDISEKICNDIAKLKNLSKKSINRLEFIINELVENLYKYSDSYSSEYVTLTVYEVKMNSQSESTFIISTSNYADSENVRGIVKSFKIIKKEFSNESYQYDKSFLGTRGHMGWITITKFNTMTHILATRVSKNSYILETNVLVTDKTN